MSLKRGKLVDTRTEWDFGQGGMFSKSAISRHGTFMGSGCLTYLGPLVAIGPHRNSYNFEVAPVDYPDYVAMEHDLDQEDIGTFDWLEDTRTLPGDRRAIKQWREYWNTIATDTKGEFVDPITGRAPSNEAIQATSNAITLFRAMIKYKEWKIKEMGRRGLDQNNPSDMKKVTIDDYGIKWYEIKRKAGKILLKSGQN